MYLICWFGLNSLVIISCHAQIATSWFFLGPTLVSLSNNTLFLYSLIRSAIFQPMVVEDPVCALVSYDTLLTETWSTIFFSNNGLNDVFALALLAAVGLMYYYYLRGAYWSPSYAGFVFTQELIFFLITLVVVTLTLFGTYSANFIVFFEELDASLYDTTTDIYYQKMTVFDVWFSLIWCVILRFLYLIFPVLALSCFVLLFVILEDLWLIGLASLVLVECLIFFRFILLEYS